MSDEKRAPTLAEAAQATARASDTAVVDHGRCTIRVEMTLPGQPTLRGDFVLRAATAEDGRQIGIQCATLSGGVPWTAIPVADQALIRAMASLNVLTEAAPAWFRSKRLDEVWGDLYLHVYERYRDWHVGLFRAGTAHGGADAPRPLASISAVVVADDGPQP